MTSYSDFLRAKVASAPKQGVSIDISTEINPRLKPHQQAIVQWMVEGGRRACFASFGLGKSVIQLEAVRIVRQSIGGMGLIVCPLGVKQEFQRDAMQVLGWEKPPKFIRRIEECDDPEGIYLTNYESIRDGKLDPAEFVVASLDEASILRGFGGTKTFRQAMVQFTGDGGHCGEDRADGKSVKYRFVATATPSPNEYEELLAYAAFLEIMDVGQAKTRFFKRDSTKADKLTLHPHKEEEFWLWVSSWGIFVERPSNLGFADEGYSLPELAVNWHCVSTDHSKAGFEKSGQGKLFVDAALGLAEAAKEKRQSIPDRVAKTAEIVGASPDDHFLLWHDLEDERKALQAAMPEAISVWGSQDLEEREKRIIGFSDGEFRILSTKPVIAGSGCNFQRHCHRAIFTGIGFKFNDFIQAIHRIYRFGQTEKVTIDIIYTEAEEEVKKTLVRKWENHKNQVKKMTDIIKQFGLSQAALAERMRRGIGIDNPEVVKGERFEVHHNDCVAVTEGMEENSVDLIVTSIPFSNQYEYSPNYADFGHSDNSAHFFQQMDFLIPNLLRVLKPGRIAAIHVKDRITPSGISGLGFQTVQPFHMDTTEAFTRHGFGYLGMKTIVTDVVRENNQTYRLGWTEQCKDGTKMGVGMPEYLLIFRKPATDRSRMYADLPVVKDKETYSRGRWQTDAHGFARSDGNRLLDPDELAEMDHKTIFQTYKRWSLEEVYNHEHHVRLTERLEEARKLPTTFMLLQPQSWSDDVWSDIFRAGTLNMQQERKGQEQHLCPLQFDIVDRAINQWSNKDELIYDPFGGIMTVPYRALKLGRRGMAAELNHSYFWDGVSYCQAMEAEVTTPTLFDFEEIDNPKPTAMPA